MPLTLQSNQSASGHFTCHLCGGTHARVIIDSLPPNTSATTDALSTYACTSRVHSQHLRVVECTVCRLRALHPAPPPEDVQSAYAAVEDPEYLTIEAHRARAFAALAQRVSRFRAPPGTLLDVGCYTGMFVGAALDAGWDAYGLEPSRWAAARALERLPGRIEAGFLRDAPYPPRSFDVITAWDVVEHLTNPREDVGHMARLLKPGGWLFLSTMASEAFVVKLLGRRWPWYMDMHRYYFTPRTLGVLLEQTGLTQRAVEPYAHATSLRYVFWKLEPMVGPIARWAGGLVRALGIAERTVPIDLGDFFLAVAQRVEVREPVGAVVPRAAARATQRETIEVKPL